MHAQPRPSRLPVALLLLRCSRCSRLGADFGCHSDVPRRRRANEGLDEDALWGRGNHWWFLGSHYSFVPGEGREARKSKNARVLAGKFFREG
jgi:hypothetical protein